VVRAFAWHDGERLIRFGRGVAAEAVEALGGPGYLLLTTPRAGAMLPPVGEAAAGVHHVAAGGVPELAAEALAWARSAGDSDGRIVALGGGRVVDVAKAVAAALGDRSGEGEASGRGGSAQAMAIPTTLSGAEMTRVHRHAAGVEESTRRVRCSVVLCDPELAASQPEDELAASALNALGHAFEGPCTVAAHPVAALVAHDAARRLVGAFAPRAPDRDALALGALLAGYTIDSTGYGLHHVMAQTLVRLGVAGHGQSNAVLLPHTTGALAWRFPAQHAALTEALDEDPAAAAERLCARTGATRLRDLGVARGVLDACADAAATRRELDHTPPRADRAELRALYEAAF
jgi:alcohol dehydrogenase class IV